MGKYLWEKVGSGQFAVGSEKKNNVTNFSEKLPTAY